LASKNIHVPLILPVYLPGALLGTAAQAVLILLPLYVIDVGGSLAAASAAVGFRGLGMMAFDLPAGLLAARYGDKLVMLFAVLVIGGAQIAYAQTRDVALICLIAFANGAGSSSFLLGRMSYITSVCAPDARGRVIAILAGTMRGTALAGPLAGAALVEFAGFAFAFKVAAGTALVGLIAIAVFALHEQPIARDLRVRSMFRLIAEYRKVFSTAGIAAIAFMLMRSARTVLIPLIGTAIGLDVGAIGFIVSASATVDIALFYPAGLIMDKFGRRSTAVPSSALMALSIAALALATGFKSLLVVALLAGVANGLSTGIVMTLGTDLAPPDRRSEFLGMWRLLTDFGTAAGPLAIGLVVAVSPIGAACLTIAGLGAAGSYTIYRYVEETLVTSARGP
jgi:MFS family permease